VTLELSESDSASLAKRLLDEHQWFLAYDAAKAGIAQYPQSLRLRHLAARALIPVGATEEAFKVLTAQSAQDEETLGLLARVHKARWLESGSDEDARQCREMYLRAFQISGGHWTCINAASMSWIIAQIDRKHSDEASAQREEATAKSLAQQTLAACANDLKSDSDEKRFWSLASAGEAYLHLNRPLDAVKAFLDADAIAKHNYNMLVSAARQFRLLKKHGLWIPGEIEQILRPPMVIVYTGHMIDEPNSQTRRFPPQLEQSVRRRIDEELDQLNPKIAYGSAACGADLLFIEALLDRSTEVNIVLPFKADDFIETSVRHAGPQWIERFNRILERCAERITYATSEQYLGTKELFAFTNHLVETLAYLRARSLATTPDLVAVLDRNAPMAPGGTADFVARWPDKNKLKHVIDLSTMPVSDETVAETTPAPEKKSMWKSAAPSAIERVIRTMLFADIVGYSKLPEELVPYFHYLFFEQAAKRIEALPRPQVLETMGDGVFSVADRALPQVRLARVLMETASKTDWAKHGLPDKIGMRIGLHAGPVFEGIDPLTRRQNCFGTHVVRAARIEPVTLPGHMYASLQFVSMLLREQRDELGDEPEQWQFLAEYLGNVSLAKNFGSLPVYRIRERRSAQL
jgi:class 3 adenylate cyclase